MMNYRKLAKISLILVYLVIAAGAIVRMTGSGMGCPDWPKCFGYLIPPTEASQLQWHPNKEYKEGQVIIRNETLRVARTDFVTAEAYSDKNWDAYAKHNYAVFNVSHTWTEYINRLLGALAGLSTLLLAFFSIKYWKTQKRITLLSLLVVFAMGFQAWLGATVVFSVLEPVKITIHMVMALLIVALLLYLIYDTEQLNTKNSFGGITSRLLALALALTMVQIIMGTQVRQFIDVQIDIFGEQAKNLWLSAPSLSFYIHRSFSILVVLVNFYIWYSLYKRKAAMTLINLVMLLLLLEITTGVLMNYFGFPFASQPLHLLLASFLFGAQFYLVLKTRGGQRTPKTL